MDIAPLGRTAPVPTAAAGGPESAAPGSEAVGSEGRAETPATSRETRIEIDPGTRDVIYRIIDADTGMVLTQIPTEALLKLRAYMRALFDVHSAEKTV